jgi:uncharacterized membrane protein YccC
MMPDLKREMKRADWTWLEVVAPDIARGLRAAVVMLVPFYLAATLGRPSLSWTALGGWLGTLADPGGGRAARARALLVFALAGGLLVGLTEPIAPLHEGTTIALAFIAFSMSIVRAWGGTAGSVGTFLAIVATIACGRGSASPLIDALSFTAGGVLALVVSSILWPVWMHLPVRRAVARVYGELASYMEAVLRGAQEKIPSNDPRWTALARSHPRGVRAAIESAREVALSVRARRDGETQFGGDVRALLGTAEAEFPLLSALVVELESLTPDARLAASARLGPLAAATREVQRILVVREIRRRPRMPRTSLPPPPTSAVTDTLGFRLTRATDIAKELAYGLAEPRDDDAAPEAETPATGRNEAGAPITLTLRPRPPKGHALRVLGDALSPRSPFFQHALRVALAVAAASVVGERLSPSRAYWVTLTTLAILQPHAGATIKRASERVVGTVLGSLVALAVMVTVRSPIGLSLIMVPLSVASVATRPRSYRLFTLFLTPVFVLLADRSTGNLWVAATRAGDALLGGAVALVAGVFVAPVSEKDKLPEALGAMFEGIAAYARLVLDPFGDGGTAVGRDKVPRLRRAVGIVLSDAETSLERFLSEPLHDKARAGDAMLAVTYGRRLTGAITSFDTMAVETRWLSRDAEPYVHRVSAYVAEILRIAKNFADKGLGARLEPSARAKDEPPPPNPEGDADAPAAQALERIVRWTALLGSVVRTREDMQKET